MLGTTALEMAGYTQTSWQSSITQGWPQSTADLKRNTLVPGSCCWDEAKALVSLP